MDKVHVCIIGAGWIAARGHIPAYQKLSEQTVIDGIFAPNIEKCRTTAEVFGIPRIYDNVEEMLKECRPDLVSICVPNNYHAQMTELSLQHGCNVICEKPLALSYKETKNLYRLAEEKHLTLCCCQNFRFTPGFPELRDAINNNVFGEIYYGEFSWIRNNGIPSWGHFCQAAYNGGGAFADMGVHPLDLVLWLMGNPNVVSVAGSSSQRLMNKTAKDCDVEEFASGSISLDNQKSLNFKAAWCANIPDERIITLLGEYGGIQIRNETIALYHTGECLPYQNYPLEEHEFPDLEFPSHCRLIRNVIHHILFQEELVIKPEETLNVVTALDQFYHTNTFRN